MKKSINREINVLTDVQHVQLRPEMYVGSIIKSEEKIPIIENDRIIQKNKTYSIGFYKLFDETFDNALDEIKRCFNEGVKRGYIKVYLNTAENLITVEDSGRGFKNAEKINKKSKLTNVETAVSCLRAGSNFYNDDIEDSLIGTNGVGIAIVNMLSEKFIIDTINNKKHYHQTWNNFIAEKKEIQTNIDKSIKGTRVSFIPSKTIFKDLIWDSEILLTKMIFKYFLLNKKKNNKIFLEFYIDDIKQNLNISFLPQNSFLFDEKNKELSIYAWPIFPNSTSVSFVNDALCTGIHQKIVQDVINKKLFDNENAYKFYETFIIINLPPKHVKFSDQNKSRFVASRQELELLLKFDITPRQYRLYKNYDFYNDVVKKIEEFDDKNSEKKLKRAKRENKIILSSKFFPSVKKDSLFVTEGISSVGSLSQARNSSIHALYALKGKIKNTKTIDDLSSNNEIIELINILNLKLEDQGQSCQYKRIVISTDSDCLDKNTIVQTKNGQRKISEVTYEDEVLSSDNQYHKVLNIVETEKEEIVKININGDIIKCGENHTFIIVRNGKIIEEKAKNILTTDFFLIKK